MAEGTEPLTALNFLGSYQKRPVDKSENSWASRIHEIEHGPFPLIRPRHIIRELGGDRVDDRPAVCLFVYGPAGNRLQSHHPVCDYWRHDIWDLGLTVRGPACSLRLEVIKKRRRLTVNFQLLRAALWLEFDRRGTTVVWAAEAHVNAASI